MGLIVEDTNLSWVSVTLFSNDVLELGQHWEKIVGFFAYATDLHLALY